jgi:tRNA_anti-like
MRKKTFFAAGIVLLCLGLLGIYKIYQPHHNVEGEQPVGKFSAAALYNEFLHDETTATRKWVGKVVEVTGTISGLSENGDHLSISLDAAPEGGINCGFLKRDLSSDAKLSKGGAITIKGKCTGFLMDVNMVDCVLIK